MSSLTDKVNNQQQIETTIMSALSSAYPSVSSKKLTDADEKIERLFLDFEKIMHYISYPCDDVEAEKRRPDSINPSTASSVSLYKIVDMMGVFKPENRCYSLLL